MKSQEVSLSSKKTRVKKKASRGVSTSAVVDPREHEGKFSLFIIANSGILCSFLLVI